MRAFVFSVREGRSYTGLEFLESITEADVSMQVQSLAVMSRQRISNTLSNADCVLFQSRWMEPLFCLAHT